MLSIYFEELAAHQYRNRPKDHRTQSGNSYTDLEIGDEEEDE
jgi:hypothetical protein